MKLLTFFLHLILAYSVLFADFSVPFDSDSDYSKISTPNGQIIYSNEYQKEAFELSETANKMINEYAINYGFMLPNDVSMIIASSNDQIANAYSTQFPFNKMVLYNGGNSMIDYFVYSDWITAVFLHELSHNYQISAQKSDISKFAKKYFGSSGTLQFLPIPLFTFPNIAIPNFILEGNAVFNESRFGIGGRLFSGYSKAMFLSLLKKHKLDLKRVTNRHLSFPYMQEKYIVGGFFFQFLANKFGVEKSNKFFYNFSEKIINPLRLNDGFKKHFGQTFEQLFYEFLFSFKTKADEFRCLKNQKEAVTVLKSQTQFDLTNDRQNIYIFTSDMKSQPQLFAFDKNSEKLKFIGDKDYGRVFFDSQTNDYLFARSSYTDIRKIQFALWSDRTNDIVKNSESRLFLDKFNSNWLYFDMKNSFKKPKLFYNDKFYDTVDSTARFDNKGNIYYFKNSDNINKNYIRTLFKNKKALFHIKGFYSKVVDFDRENIYFISYTKLGSSLYRYNEKNKNIYLVFDFDNIIDARITSRNKFILNTINANGYEYILIKSDKKNQKIVKKLPFDEAFSDIVKFDTSIDTLLEEDINISKPEKYNAIFDIRFEKLAYQYSSFYNIFNLSFEDPIGYNSFATNFYLEHNNKSNIISFSYINKRYLDFILGASKFNYVRDSKVYNLEDFEQFYTFSAYIGLPIFKKDTKEIKISLKSYNDKENIKNIPTIVTINYSNLNQYGYSMFANKVNYHSFATRYARKNFLFKMTNLYQTSFADEFFFRTKLETAYSQKVKPSQQKGVYLTSNGFEVAQDSTHIQFNALSGDYRTKSAIKLSPRLTKVLNYDLYSFELPIAIRREAIFGEYSRLYYNIEELSKEKYMDEWSVGVYFDVLFAHKYQPLIPVMLKYSHNIFEKNSQFSFSLGFSF
jgi:hypothetical protein